jgi:hypothetical protein
VPLPIEFWDIIGYVQVDPDTDRLFYTSFTRAFGFESNPIGYSDDDGETWHVTRIGGAGNGEPESFGDMGTIFIGPPPAGTETSGYPNVIYTCNFSPWPSSPASNVQCWRSLDGGESFQRPDPDNATLPRAGAPGCTETGYIFPNRGLVAPNGTVYLPVAWCGQWVVGVSTDAGKTFTWNEVTNQPRDPAILADQLANLPGCAGSTGWAGCPEVFQTYGQERLAQDAKGTLYFIFNNHQLMLSISKDGGKSWTEPTPMSLPGVQTVWSSIAAQGRGRVGLSYLGKKEGSNDWHGYMAVVDNADKPRARKIATALVSAPDNPLMPYRCCGSKFLITEPMDPNYNYLGYNLFEHGGLKFAPDGSLWAAFFRDSTRDEGNTQSAAYEIVTGHMVKK